MYAKRQIQPKTRRIVFLISRTLSNSSVAFPQPIALRFTYNDDMSVPADGTWGRVSLLFDDKSLKIKSAMSEITRNLFLQDF